MLPTYQTVFISTTSNTELTSKDFGPNSKVILFSDIDYSNTDRYINLLRSFIIILSNDDLKFMKSNRKNPKYVQFIKLLSQHKQEYEFLINGAIKYLIVSKKDQSWHNSYDGTKGYAVDFSPTQQNIIHHPYSSTIDGQVYRIDANGLKLYSGITI